ncbi:MAG: alkaline ceramidase [Pirellulales bacterium]
MPAHSSFTGQAGLARTDITPPVGIFCRNWGAALHDTAQGIHRPLLLTALAICDAAGGDPLLLLDADLGWWASLAYERKFRGRVCAALGLPEERLLFCVTHTHSAPPLCTPEPQWQGGDLLAAYLVAVEERAIKTARQAIASLAPARIEWHQGRCGLAANRDLPDPAPPAAPRLVCGFNPANPADDTLLVARITDTAGTPLATIANYACHPTTLAWDNDLVSPDFVGEMRSTIEREGAGRGLFLQGASGELAPRYQYVGDPAGADAHGRGLGHAVLATVHAMEPPGQRLTYDRVVESGAALAVWRREPGPTNPLIQSLAAKRRTVDLPLKDWPSAAELAAQFAACTDRPIAERLRRKLRIREALGDGPAFPLEIWGWRIGEALVLGTMAEAYSSIQRNVRAAFPDRAVVWLNLVNGSIGYLPPAPLYDVDVYQVWQTPFDRGSLETLEAAAIDLGRGLLAG